MKLKTNQELVAHNAINVLFLTDKPKNVTDQNVWHDQAFK